MTDNNIRVIDYRSDTVTLPSLEMKDAMIKAPLGDDVFGEDPTVNVLAHCWNRGSEVIVGDQSHIYLYEQGGIAQLGGVHPWSLKNLPDGTFSLEELKVAVRGDNIHWPVTKLVCVENTHNRTGGKVIPLIWLTEVAEFCKSAGISLHMDGARLLNASVATGISPKEWVKDCSSVSLCLNKGLGAPVGAVIAGTKDFIARALRLRKVLGGGMRQAGVLAAAGIFALTNYEHLKEDHDNAKIIAKALHDFHSPYLKIKPDDVHTNILILYFCHPELSVSEFCTRLMQVTVEEEDKIGRCQVRAQDIGRGRIRLVTHCNTSQMDADVAVKKMAYILNEI